MVWLRMCEQGVAVNQRRPWVHIAALERDRLRLNQPRAWIALPSIRIRAWWLPP